MTRIVTAVYDSADKVHIATDDLIDTGIPREKIFAAKKAGEIKVMVPAPTSREVWEILERHQPIRIDEHELSEER